MTAPTHITFAGFIYLLLLTTTGVALSTVNAIAVAISSVLPDVDTTASFVGRALPFLSRRIERKFGHRTLTHSATFVAGLAVLLSPVCLHSLDIYVCILMGYASHPFLDTMTVHGVKLFYPFSRVKCVFPFEVNNPHRYRLQTGSKVDNALGVIFFLGCIPTFLIAQQGYERFIRTTQKNIESAVRDYNEFSKDHFVSAEITAYNMMTKERILGTFELVGTLSQNTILFKIADGSIYSLGKEYDADYVAERIICIPGEPATTLVQTIDLSNQLISQLLAHVDLRYQTHLFGSLVSSDPFSIPQSNSRFSPVLGSFSNIQFNYATYADIQRLSLENIFVNKGMLTIRTVVPKSAAYDHSIPNFDQTSPTASAIGIPDQSTTFTLTHLSFELDPKESFEIVQQRGDTVQAKDVLIRRDLARFFNQQIELAQRRMIAIRQEREYDLADLDQKLSLARHSLDQDSAGFVYALRQYKSGYSTDLALELARRAHARAAQDVSQLLSARTRVETRFDIEHQRLTNEISQLRSKEMAAVRQSEILATTSGVVQDIRQLYHNNKIQVTFVLRRIPYGPRSEK